MPTSRTVISSSAGTCADESFAVAPLASDRTSKSSARPSRSSISSSDERRCRPGEDDEDEDVDADDGERDESGVARARGEGVAPLDERESQGCERDEGSACARERELQRAGTH